MNTKIKYRAEIDGLRAIAVFAVIFYHSEAELFDSYFFPGGFIGVDIFFVISGYLITSLILKELKFTNNFSFKNFYERRTRRIIPALLTVILFSLPVGWFYLLPIDIIEFSKSILYSIGFSSNYFFYFSDIEYNALDSLFKPFLHTWSLSVEEQYYILFPVTLLLIFKFFRKFLLTFLFIILIGSLILANLTGPENFSLNFYSIHTRIWQLISGSILAYIEISKNYRSNNNSLNEFLPILGLIFIFYSFFFYNDKILHPSFTTILPIIGVCLVIWFSNEGGIVTKILSSKYFVGTGLISYSLYLWHFPIFSFAKIIEFTEGDLLKKAFLIILTIIVSKISFKFIEQRFRNRNITSLKTLIYSIIFSLGFIIIFNVAILQNNGFKDRLPKILQQSSGTEFIWKTLKNEKGETCWKKVDDYCIFNPDGKKKAIIIGDSQVGSIAPNLKDRLIAEDYRVKIILFGGCWYLPDFTKFESTGEIDDSCDSKTQNKIREILLSSTNETIIIGGRLPLYLSKKYFDNEEGGEERRLMGSDFGYFKSLNNSLTVKKTIRNSLNELLEKGHKVVLIYPIPEVGWHVPKKINSNWKNRFFNNEYKKDITTSFEVFKKRTKESFDLLNSINHTNLSKVYPHKLFCNNPIKDRCITHDDRFIFYADDDHPSKVGAKMINNLILDKILK